MKVGSISGNESPSVGIFFVREKNRISRGRLLKSLVVVDMVVVLEDECGSSILVNLRGSNNDDMTQCESVVCLLLWFALMSKPVI